MNCKIKLKSRPNQFPFKHKSNSAIPRAPRKHNILNTHNAVFVRCPRALLHVFAAQRLRVDETRRYRANTLVVLTALVARQRLGRRHRHRHRQQCNCSQAIARRRWPKPHHTSHLPRRAPRVSRCRLRVGAV